MDNRLERVLLAAGRTSIGSRLLRFYDDRGLLGDGPAATPPDEPTGEATTEILQELWDRYLSHIPTPAFADLAEDLADDGVPSLDRRDTDEIGLSADQLNWREHGYVVKKAFIPNDLLDAYWELRSQLDRPHGWETTAAYLHFPEVLNLSTYRPLTDLLAHLIGEPMAVNLNLTSVVSTERNWHQDDYLNPPEVKGWYAAVWCAVRDVDPDSGPFQYVPGSHRWPVLRRDRVRLFLRPDERDFRDWPRLTERFLNDVLDTEIRSRDASVESFLGEQGDVLVWHSRLVHRGSPPKVPGRIRAGFISHYTALSHWAGGRGFGRHPDGGYYVLQDAPIAS